MRIKWKGGKLEAHVRAGTKRAEAGVTYAHRKHGTRVRLEAITMREGEPAFAEVRSAKEDGELGPVRMITIRSFVDCYAILEAKEEGLTLERLAGELEDLRARVVFLEGGGR